MGKKTQTAEPKYEVLISDEFYGSVDSWTEYLCLARHSDGRITLSSRSREILAEAAPYRKRDYLPATIRRKKVWGYDGDYVVGEKLLLHDGEAELTVSPNDFEEAARWLISRKWDRHSKFGRAWADIRAALYTADFFRLVRPRERNAHSAVRGSSSGNNRVSPSQPNSAREVVIRFPGPAKPWSISMELVCIELDESNVSVYVRASDAVSGSTDHPELVARIPGPLNWRKVLDFVQAHDLADASGNDPKQLHIYGVQRWQRDIIATAMLRRAAIVQLLRSLTDKELVSLHIRLRGFLTPEPLGALSRLASVTDHELFRRKSLARIAQLVGSPDPLDLEKLATDCAVYLADRRADTFLSQYNETSVPTEEAFLSLINCGPPGDLPGRAGLFEVWLRTDPKPKGGAIAGMRMDDELPVVEWLLRDRVAEIFKVLVPTRAEQLRRFALWFLDRAWQYTRYFTGEYKFTSYVVYTFGRPRFRRWAKLAREVEDAAISVGIPIPEAVRLPHMPHLDAPTMSYMITSRESRRA